MKNKYSAIILLVITSFFASCSPTDHEARKIDREAAISPDYSEVTMPCNIAAPTFMLADSVKHDNVQAIFTSGNKTFIVESDEADGICVGNDNWKELVNASDTINVRIQMQTNSGWEEYRPFNIYVSRDTIDSHLAYRLIEPGYEVWNKMGIYQRNMTNYDEEAIITNQATNGGCMNCHSFCNRDAQTMLFHLRVDFPGTYILKGGRINKCSQQTTPDGQNIPLTYPAWHPSGRFVAFSSNSTKQMFHTTDVNRIEVFDYSSDIIVYDTENDNVVTCQQLFSPSSFETFPSFSHDGKYLYFCTADSVEIPKDYDKVRYSLCRIEFDESTKTFGDKVDTLYNASSHSKSVSFPRMSPDGNYLVFTVSDYGNFSIWHKEADLWMLNLTSNSMRPLKEINSRDVDSYHSWSSNSRWMVFSSRRDDGLYTRPYICHIDKDGNCSKAFLLPQADANFYQRLMKSFNIPELVNGKVNLPPMDLGR